VGRWIVVGGPIGECECSNFHKGRSIERGAVMVAENKRMTSAEYEKITSEIEAALV
jgi:hypothetical protein